jgi:hypothetical protein
MKAHRTMVTKAIRQTTAALTKRSSLLAQKVEFERKYVGLDTKGSNTTPFDDALALVDMEVKALKDMMSGLLGERSIEMPVAVQTNVTNGTSGTNVKVIVLDPSFSNDWAALQALFDEVKTTHVAVTYFPSSFAPSSVAAPLNSPVAIFVYDPADAAALSGAAGTFSQYDLHRMYMLAQEGNNAVATFNTASLNTPHHLNIPVPKGSLLPVPTVANTPFVGAAWVATAGSAGTVDPVGCIKFAEINGFGSAAIVGALVQLYTVHLRMRI